MSIRIFKNILIAICMVITPLLSQSYGVEKPKRLYIQAFEKKQGITDSLEEKFKDNLLLFFFEQGSGKYRVISESDIAIMYKQAESMMKSGCNAEECLTAIAYAIDADIIIYGKMEKSADKINIFAQSLKRNKETDELIKQSIVQVMFNESQMVWYAKEIVKKLINPKYYIDPNKAPVEIQVEVAPGFMQSKSLATKKLKLLKFKTDDSALQKITSVLKNTILEGDNYYQKKDTANARMKYEKVITKIETRISSDKQEKLKDFKEDVFDRIAAAYSMDFQNVIKNGDEKLKDKDYAGAYGLYKSIDSSINNIPQQEVQTRLNEFYQTIKERKDIIQVVYAKQKMLQGDGYYSDYKFEQAIAYYEKALDYTDKLEIRNNKEHNKLIADIKDKKSIAKKTGDSYYKNQVQSYCDKIDVFNIQEEDDKAKLMLFEFYDYEKSSMFSDSGSRGKLEEMASLLHTNPGELEEERMQRERERRLREQQEKRRKEAQQWYAKRLLIDLEFGGGHIMNGYFSYKAAWLGLGVGSSYTFGTYEVLGKSLDESYFNFTGHVDFHFMESKYWWLNLRQKAGYEWISIDDSVNEWPESGMFLSTGLLIGYRTFFADVCMPMFFGRDGTAIGIQMGAGVRFRTW